jgi:hypothetical protein
MRSIMFSSSRTLPGQFQFLQHSHSLLGNGFDMLAHATGVFGDERMHQLFNVATPLAKRRQLNGEDIPAVKQIFAVFDQVLVTVFAHAKYLFGSSARPIQNDSGQDSQKAEHCRYHKLLSAV